MASADDITPEQIKQFLEVIERTNDVKKHKDRRPLAANKRDPYAEAMHDEMDFVLPMRQEEGYNEAQYKYDDQYRI